MPNSLFTPFPGKKLERSVSDGHAKAQVILGKFICYQSQSPWLSGVPPSPAANFRKLLDCTTSSWEAGTCLWPSCHCSGNPRWAPAPSASIPMIMKSFFRLWLCSWFKAPLLVLSSSHQHSFHTRMALRNWGVQNLHKQMIQNTLVGAWGHPEQSGREWLPWETGAWRITRYPDPRKTPTGSWLKSWV